MVVSTAFLLAAMTSAVAQSPPPMMIIDAPTWVLNFDFDDSRLNAKAAGQVADFGQFYTTVAQGDMPVVRVVVVGHADTAGSGDYNVVLSKKRAIHVADALVAAGIPAGIIAVDWKGETQPAVVTGDGVSKAENRYVSVDVAF